MKALDIISQGPSWTLFPGRREGHVVCGVNSLASRIECDWWCFIDSVVFAQHRPIGRPSLWVPTRVPYMLGMGVVGEDPRYPASRVKHIWQHPMASHELVSDRINPRIDYPPNTSIAGRRYNLHGGLAAMGLAMFLCVDEVYVYGMDMTGPDGADRTDERQRRDARWERERFLWAEIVNCLIDVCGMVVLRYTQTTTRRFAPGEPCDPKEL